MTTQTHFDLPGTAPALKLRIRAGWERALERRRTREYGRKYLRTEICPKCFRSYTVKGITRHSQCCPGRKEQG